MAFDVSSHPRDILDLERKGVEHRAVALHVQRQNAIGSRLRAHKSRRSGNVALGNYIASYAAKFTYHTVEVLKVLGSANVLELESFFLRHFLVTHGAYPICNNQSGVLFPGTQLEPKGIAIDWAFFGAP